MYIHTKINCPNCSRIIKTIDITCPNCGKKGYSHLTKNSNIIEFECLHCKHTFQENCFSCKTDFRESMIDHINKNSIPEISEPVGSFNENLSLIKEKINYNLQHYLTDYDSINADDFLDHTYLTESINPNTLLEDFLKGINNNPLYDSNFKESLDSSKVSLEIQLFIHRIPKLNCDLIITKNERSYYTYETTHVKERNVYDSEGLKVGSYETDVKQTNRGSSLHEEKSPSTFSLNNSGYVKKNLKEINSENLNDLLMINHRENVTVFKEKEDIDYITYYKERYKNYIRTQDELYKDSDITKLQWESFKKNGYLEIAHPVYIITIKSDKTYKVVVTENNVLDMHDLPINRSAVDRLDSFKTKTKKVLKSYLNIFPRFAISQLFLIAMAIYVNILVNDGEHSLFIVLIGSIILYAIIYGVSFFIFKIIINKIDPISQKKVSKILNQIDPSITRKYQRPSRLDRHSAIKEMNETLDDKKACLNYYNDISKNSVTLENAILGVHSEKLMFLYLAILEYIFIGAIMILEYMHITDLF